MSNRRLRHLSIAAMSRRGLGVLRRLDRDVAAMASGRVMA